MKSIISITFIVIVNSANAQLSISGGYIRRTEDSQLNLSAHFGTKKPESNLNLYNYISFQGMYQTKASSAFSIKLGGFPQRQVDYLFRQSYYSGGGLDGVNNYSITKRSTINYYGLNLGLGFSFLLKAKNPKERKIKSETRIGLLLQLDATFNHTEKNQSTHYYKAYTNFTPFPTPITTVYLDSNSYASFRSIAKSSLFSSFGISVNERVVFMQHFFLELQVSIGLTSAKRLIGIKSGSSDNCYECDERFDNMSVDRYNNYHPILETGIGVGYIFNRKKEQLNLPQ